MDQKYWRTCRICKLNKTRLVMVNRYSMCPSPQLMKLLLLFYLGDIFWYCMSRKSWPFSYCHSQHKIGHTFLTLRIYYSWFDIFNNLIDYIGHNSGIGFQNNKHFRSFQPHLSKCFVNLNFIYTLSLFFNSLQTQTKLKFSQPSPLHSKNFLCTPGCKIWSQCMKAQNK